MIAWVDVETTGLEPSAGALLEVGIVLTDDALNELDRTVVALKVRRIDIKLMRQEVYEMHGRSGLLFDCENFGLEIDEAEQQLTAWLVDRATTPVMAGNTVGFDRKWLTAKMPRLAGEFHYRSIDVSSLKELNERWDFAAKWVGDRKIHRALPDLEDSIAELRFYRDSLGL